MVKRSSNAGNNQAQNKAAGNEGKVELLKGRNEQPKTRTSASAPKQWQSPKNESTPSNRRKTT